MRKIYQITEYGSFITGKQIAGYTTLPKETFEQLEAFILTNRSRDADALELMGLSAKKGIGKVITAKNYVGVLTMNDGTSIEILPKIYSKSSYSESRVKQIVVDMLKTLRDSPYKTLQSTNVDIEKMGIFEVFIRMFLDEVFFIVKRGLKSSYEAVCSNENFFKGKLLFASQIKYNYAHKERAYVEFNAFHNNRPENRLIKSTLLYLYRQTASSKNKADLKTLLNAFDEVSSSVDYSGDFAKVVPDRNMKDYMTALQWCKVFLMGKSFTSFSGSEVAFALLFPMETLFESYIAVQLQKVLGTTNFRVSAQDKTYHLFTLPSKKFLMKPDIVVYRKSDKEVFVCDTKWKLLADEKANYGISQADMYQMYAYQKKYGARNITLLYPLTDRVANNRIEYNSGDGVTVRVRFIDLLDPKHSLSAIAREFAYTDSESEPICEEVL